MQLLVVQAANRLAPQAALRQYNAGNVSAQLWEATALDYDAVFSGDANTRLVVQVQLYGANSSDYSAFNRTAGAAAGIVLPYTTPNGQNATLGDPQYGFIPQLYPKFDIQGSRYNSTFNTYKATWNGRVLDNTSLLFVGPYHVNDTLSLVSITTPVINNTSTIDTLGWITLVMDTTLITNVINGGQGLGDTGVTMLFGPNNVTNNFPKDTLFDAPHRGPTSNEEVVFVVQPTNRTNVQRHQEAETVLNPAPFSWTRFPAIEQGFTQPTNDPAGDNSGSIVATINENGDRVAVGYAMVESSLVDWLIVVEQAHSEVWQPIYHLRKVILACVFGTIGFMILFSFPVAHFSSQPIRRLRDATRKTVAPHLFDNDSFSSHHDGANEDSDEATLARKEGFMGSILHYRRNQKVNRAEKRELERRRQFRIPAKVKDRKHFIHDELTDLTKTFNEMTDELMMQYEKLEERVAQRTAELEQSKKAAEAANESKTLFIANISHELKTPLNGILGMTAVCMSEDDPVKMKRSLGIIYKSGDLLLNLLTDLLTFR